jgi:hypothetical protein
MSTPFRSRPGALVLALTVALVAGGCSSDGPSAGPGPGTTETVTTTSVSGPAPLTTRAEVGTVVGRLPGTRRKAVRVQVTDVLDRWWDAAYVGGEYPRTDFGRYPGFTPGAARRATYDRDLMSNADIGERVVSVTPLMRRARLDLLAVDRRVRSVTARFDLRMRVDLAGADAPSRRLQVRGRVFLTRQAAGWRVFGYDVTKGWLA